MGARGEAARETGCPVQRGESEVSRDDDDEEEENENVNSEACCCICSGELGMKWMKIALL